MIIIDKKRILITLSVVALSMFVFTFQIANTNKNINIVQTVALPVSNKVIVLDAGHGKPDEGAQSSNRDHRGRNKP